MATTYIHRTPGSAGNQRTWTYSAWVKRGNLGSRQGLYNVNAATDPYIFAEFVASDALNIQDYDGSQDTDLVTTRLFRDVGAWYHIVIAYDTTQSTPADRIKLYVNGVQETSFSTETYCAEDFDTQMNTTVELRLGREGAGSNYFDGSMSHVQLVDGLQLAPTEFGEVDSTSGIWKIKTDAYATPGTNGFYLKMEDRTNLDLDSSSNAHTFTTSGTLTATSDNPSNNFCTMNPLDNYYQGATFANGNLNVVTDTSKQNFSTATMGVSAGKWYWETKMTDLSGWDMLGIAGRYVTSTSEQELGEAVDCWAYYSYSGQSYNNATLTAYGDTYADGDIIGVALDLDNNKLYFSKNGTFQNSGVPTSGATGTGAISINAASTAQIGVYLPAFSDYGSTQTADVDFNFGNGYFGTTAITSAGVNAGSGLFEYDVPSGYLALNTKNIATYG